ncbi:MAG: methyltransferase domain-containing protein [Myxococcota bacterium]|nr:methyltransferase domain-containing protein [Myxococcota bacterium]
MKALDRLLQRWRIAKAGRHIPAGSTVLDVGCHDGALFRQLGARLSGGLGIDAELGDPVEFGGFRLLPGHFPNDLGESDRFDVISMLAVLEHVPPEEQRALADACARHLRPGGLLVITTPAPAVDHILDFLAAIRVIDGMSLEQHYGFEPGDTPGIFAPAGFELVVDHKFQLGLNRLFVLRAAGAGEASGAAAAQA